MTTCPGRKAKPHETTLQRNDHALVSHGSLEGKKYAPRSARSIDMGQNMQTKKPCARNEGKQNCDKHANQKRKHASPATKADENASSLTKENLRIFSKYTIYHSNC